MNTHKVANKAHNISLLFSPVILDMKIHIFNQRNLQQMKIVAKNVYYAIKNHDKWQKLENSEVFAFCMVYKIHLMVNRKHLKTLQSPATGTNKIQVRKLIYSPYTRAIASLSRLQFKLSINSFSNINPKPKHFIRTCKKIKLLALKSTSKFRIKCLHNSIY